jgi:hypothetical protein
MSVFFEGNGFFDGSQLVNSTVSNTTISASSLQACTINMLSPLGNYTPITNVQNPIDNQDAATKFYIDQLGTVFNISLNNTTNSTLSTNVKGSFMITITNTVLNGPSAIFNITKSESYKNPHIVRITASPGHSTNTFLEISWPPNSNILLRKTNQHFDGSYLVKLI